MWRAPLGAVSFLTRLPVPSVVLAEADVARGAGFFAWVGWLLGGLLWLVSQALFPLGSAVSAMGVVAGWAWLTGALHLDGLADTVDGLSGGRGDRLRTLEIMRDSRIGAHGAVALCLSLGLKWAALARLLETGDVRWVGAPVVARFMCTVLLASFAYARSQGLGAAFAERVGLRELIVGAMALAPVLVWLGLGFGAAAALGCGCAWGLALRARAVLGGLTGDVHGAAIEVCEVGTLMALGLPRFGA